MIRVSSIFRCVFGMASHGATDRLVSRRATPAVLACATAVAACGPGDISSSATKAPSEGHDHAHQAEASGGPGATIEDHLGGATSPSPVAMVRPGPPPLAIEGEPWSDPATWGGHVPTACEKVTIPAGKTVVLDVSPPPLCGLSIAGNLLVKDQDVELTSTFLLVMHGGRFQLGRADMPFQHQATITLTGKSATGADDTMGMGAKVFGVMDGIVDIHGRPVARSWTKLNADAAAGATDIEVAEETGWKSGDPIVIATSSPDMSEYDLLEVSAINGNRLTLNHPLAHSHYGKPRSVGATPIDVRAEVGMLRRNVVIRGDADSESLKLGGHMMFMAQHETTVRLSDIEVTQMGQYDHLGRYPVHFHVMEDRCAGCSVENIVVHDTVQRGIVIHNTYGINLLGNVVFNTLGHNFIVETEQTRGNVFDHNLALVNRLPNPPFTNAALRTQSDDIPSSFWIKDANNTFANNAAAGAAGMGFFFDQAVSQPEQEGQSLVFERNTVHAAMTAGAARDFDIQSAVLFSCSDELPGTAKISDVLVYQCDADPSRDPAGFWVEGECQSLRPDSPPFSVDRLQVIDNRVKNIEVRGVRSLAIFRDTIATATLLGPQDRDPELVHIHYGGRVSTLR